MKDYAEDAEGIDRIAVLRMDVDNLGQAFVSGFENKENGDRYVTLSRTAAFSRQMTIFFKYHINRILNNPVCSCLSEERRKKEGRDLSIVYSGGDDVFLIGAWNEVIEAALDIRNCFSVYSQNQLTISGGIGLYGSSYPIHIMADETGELESFSKKLKNKNAVTLFSDGGRYNWDVFEKIVMGEKYALLYQFFENSEERGKSFLYKLLDYIRNREDKINVARYLYLLARLEPSDDAPEERKADYRQFSGTMYDWIRSDEDSRQLVTAIYLYAYHMRKKLGGQNEVR